MTFNLQASAEVLAHKIYAISHFQYNMDEIHENSILEFHSIDDYKISDVDTVPQNSIITIKVNKIIYAKRGKRDGYLKVKLISYTIPEQDNKTKNISSKNLIGSLKLTTKKDLKGIAKNTGISVVGHVLKVPGFSQAVAATKGLIKPNPNQNRLQSVGTNVYKSTPLVYTEKGKNIKIDEDSIVLIKIKEKDE
ncbi:MAG: hypothetical protein E7Z90_00285 [Cyanobacteria bacterium SIG29]|nr:hypothetical protein [Cyanobacteria bacterium SIG29]